MAGRRGDGVTHQSTETEHVDVLGSPLPDQDLSRALEAWRSRLAAVGVACRHVAFFAEEARWLLPFPPADSALNARWAELRTAVSADNPATMSRVDASAGADLLVATAIQLPDGKAGVVGAALAQPCNERTVQLLLLSLGWLQLSLAATSLAHNQRAAWLLELMGHVSSQDHARTAAQEWVNRTAVGVRAQATGASSSVSLTLFHVRRGVPSWWVTSDTAWAEKGSPAVQEAVELAGRAVVELREVAQGGWWALPILDQGEPVAVLVAKGPESSDGAWSVPVAPSLRASASLAEPLLRRWHEAERGLAEHAWHSIAGTWRRLWGPGYLSWKAIGGAVVLVLAVLTLWPVSDRVTASTVIEGRQSQMVTAPFDGFIARVRVRPGELVRKGQELALLDDRDLKLDQAAHRSERDQAVGKLRQAMAERDASAVALAHAALQQADAQLALVETKLARTSLLAPMDGLLVTGDWAQQIGSPVEAGKDMFEVANTNGYRVVLHVPDHDIARVKEGQEGLVRLTGHPQSAYPFRITRVTATASVEDGLNGFRVEAHWVGDVPPISPGMQGVGKVDVGTSNLLTVWTRPSLDWLRLKLWAWLW